MCLCGDSASAFDEIAFDRIVIDDDFPGGYQVEVADVNGDGKPDIVALGGGTVAWYENPNWTKRVITTSEQTSGVISSATADLDGDGKAEIAIAHDFAMREPTKGKLTLAIQGESLDDPWTLQPIADVPSIHRVRWADLNGNGRLELVVAPIFGPDARDPEFHGDPARLIWFDPGEDPKAGAWIPAPIVERPVIHAIWAGTFPMGDQSLGLVLTADNLGLGDFLWNPYQPGSWQDRSRIPGAQGDPPARGASEVHPARLEGDRSFFASIEPWHGHMVVISTVDSEGRIRRTVLDDTLDDGHALWVADIDGNGNDEVFAGHRGEDYRVSMYKYDGETWNRTVLDTDIAAQDLRGGDLDGDGVPDVVAIGGKTSNVVWYRPKLSK